MFLTLNLSSLGLLVVTAFIAFALGLLVKKGIIAKQRKRILELEDEMLANHANILTLEKKIADIQKDKADTQTDYELNKRSDHGLKAS